MWAPIFALRSNVADISASRLLEFYALRCRKAMVLPQVPVHAHRQSAAVFVTEPSAHGRNIDGRLDARRGEIMTEVVMRHLRVVQSATRGL